MAGKNNSYENKKILLAEKSKLIRMMLKNSIQELGIINVSEASDMSEILDVIRKEAPSVICMSYVFYEIDNKNIFYDIFTINPDAKVMLLSSTPKDNIDPNVITNYDVEVFNKSSNFAGLVNRIKEC